MCEWIDFDDESLILDIDEVLDIVDYIEDGMAYSRICPDVTVRGICSDLRRELLLLEGGKGNKVLALGHVCQLAEMAEGRFDADKLLPAIRCIEGCIEYLTPDYYAHPRGDWSMRN